MANRSSETTTSGSMSKTHSVLRLRCIALLIFRVNSSTAGSPLSPRCRSQFARVAASNRRMDELTVGHAPSVAGPQRLGTCHASSRRSSPAIASELAHVQSTCLVCGCISRRLFVGGWVCVRNYPPLRSSDFEWRTAVRYRSQVKHYHSVVGRRSVADSRGMPRASLAPVPRQDAVHVFAP